MKQPKLLNESGLISEESLAAIAKKSTDVSCQCPGHLVEIYKSIQAFTEYQRNCLNAKPQDEQIHKWLEITSMNLEHLLSNTIVTLARLEGMIDEDNKIRED